jgi:aryl-alcohol dehydrogenase-like predicted oxidoreductase
MRYRRMGDSGLSVSVVGLGGNNFERRIDLARTREVVHAAVDVGINHIDTADMYGGSEDYLGEVLGGLRDDVVLATKIGHRMSGKLGPDYGARGGRRYLRKALESSLRRLRTDHVDLLYYHKPDPLTPMAETLEIFDDFVREGKALYIGSSNLTAWQIADADWISRHHGWARFVAAQNEYSLIERDVEVEVIPACRHFGVGFVPFFPLGRGILTGKYHPGEEPPAGSRLAKLPEYLTESSLAVAEKVRAFAAERGVSMLQIAIGGLAATPGVSSVIAGATSGDQVRANAEAGQWEPDAETLAALQELLGPPRSPA